MTKKIINDPVHGFISIQDDLIFQIISHPIFQRLRRIKQMALAYLVYPGAVHTRLHHALGAYHLITMAMEELRQKGTEISDDEFRGAQVAILLHDIGHGPFSHALEKTLLNVSHENISIRIMKKLNSELNGALDIAISIFENKYSKKFLHQLISGQLDVDRLDYLARDSFFTGVSEGVIGYDRIIKMLVVKNDTLMVEEKGIHSIEKFLIARRLMYWQVYLHKTVLSSEIMLVHILKRAKEISFQNKPLFATPSLHYFLTEKNIEFEKNDIALEHFCLLDDHDIACCIKVWSKCDDEILSDLCNRLLNRNLFKIKFHSEKNKEEIENIKMQFAEKYHQQNSLHYYYKESETQNLMYDEHETQINILFKNGEIKNIAEVDYSLIKGGMLVNEKRKFSCFGL
ncbi:MAG: HD domain-containing protein [Chitinophagaceae bacterium]|nr:HD domain-containing protein [Chitinophagaceae bacterium]